MNKSFEYTRRLQVICRNYYAITPQQLKNTISNIE